MTARLWSILLVLCLTMCAQALACTAEKYVPASADVCLCECCSRIQPRAYNCSSRISTSRKVSTCDICSPTFCALAFPDQCGSNSAAQVVRSQCVERDGWHLVAAPALFMCVYVVLMMWAWLAYMRRPSTSQSKDGEPAFRTR